MSEKIDPKEILAVSEMPSWKKHIRPWVENKIHEYQAKYAYIDTLEELKVNQGMITVLAEFLKFIDQYTTAR